VNQIPPFPSTATELGPAIFGESTYSENIPESCELTVDGIGVMVLVVGKIEFWESDALVVARLALFPPEVLN
jgi:hypothetical protein